VEELKSFRFELTVLEGEIVSAVLRWEFLTNGFSDEMWEPFARWVSDTYPEDAAIMYTDDFHTRQRTTEESNQLWEQRSREYAGLLGP
jgi:hypothetical protein